jgi:hypothetical protein
MARLEVHAVEMVEPRHVWIHYGGIIANPDPPIRWLAQEPLSRCSAVPQSGHKTIRFVQAAHTHAYVSFNELQVDVM